MSQFENYFPTILCIVPTVSLPRPAMSWSRLMNSHVTHRSRA